MPPHRASFLRKRGSRASPKKRRSHASPKKRGSRASPKKRGSRASPKKRGSRALPKKRRSLTRQRFRSALDDFRTTLELVIEAFRIHHIDDHKEEIDFVHNKLIQLRPETRIKIFGEFESEAESYLFINVFQPQMEAFDFDDDQEVSEDFLLFMAKCIDPRLIQDYAVVFTYDEKPEQYFQFLNQLNNAVVDEQNAVNDEQNAVNDEQIDDSRRAATVRGPTPLVD